MTEAEVKSKLASVDVLKKFNAGLVLASGTFPSLWKLEANSFAWVMAELADKGKGPFIKPNKELEPIHGSMYYTASAEDFEYMVTTAKQLGVDKDNSLPLLCKIGKMFPIDIDESIVEAKYGSKNPKAVENWKEAMASKGSCRLVAVSFEELD